MFVLLRRLFLLALLGLGIGAVVYFRSEAFSDRMCTLVMEELEKRDVHTEIGRLSLHPLHGLVASNIRVYQDQEKKIFMGEIDRLLLDLDYSKMLRREFFLETVDLQEARASFPIDPEQADSERLDISDFNARLLLVGNRIEIRKAEFTFFNLRVSVLGSLMQPRPKDVKETEEAIKERRRKRIEAIKARRNLIVEGARLLKHFESATAPRLEVDINGDLDEPENINVGLKLDANGLRHGNYECLELQLVATYAGEMVDMERLYVRDRLGRFEANANWRLRSDEVRFQVRSSADLPGLASAVFQKEGLREVVFYEPPELEAEGAFLMSAFQKPTEESFLPVRCSALLSTGKFTSRGTVFEGIRASIGLSPDGCYFRDVVLRHKTGTLGLQAMWKRSEGFRYRALVQMDPNVFTPFVRIPLARDIIQRFEFDDNSSIYGELEGEGPEPNLGKCVNRGRADLRNFKYRGMEALHVTGEVEFAGPMQYYRNVYLQRREGTGTAREVSWDNKTKTLVLDQIAAELDPVAVVGCFAKKVSEVIDHYQFDKAPKAEVNGRVTVLSPDTDLKVRFQSTGTAKYPLWSELYTVSQPKGDLHFKGQQVAFAVNGGLFGAPMTCKGSTGLGPEAGAFTTSVRAESFPYEVFGETLPIRSVRAEVVGRKGSTDYDVKARVFSGDISSKGKLDTRVQPIAFKGDIRVSAVQFKEFAKVYSPTNQTGGDVTGHFNYSGRLGNWKSLKGDGALTILNSNLYAVPILGPLTPLIGAVLPRPVKGYNEAREADCTFTVSDGFVTTENIEALTGVFRLVAKGSVDFLENRVQLEAQAKMRGLPGLVFFPVSEILEYVGEGSVGDPLWRPRYFSVSQERTAFRKPGEEAVPEETPSQQPRAAPTRRRSPSRAQPPPPPTKPKSIFSKPKAPLRTGGKG